MNFLNPAILFGLFAVIIPIIIHLLNLRKIRKVEFSTLMFLKEIQKSKMRRIKLKQLLLLALRILVITFLVLCFAKPVYEGYAVNADGESNRTSLIFLDDSFSMSANDGAISNLEKGKEFVRKILEYHKPSDEIYFIRFSDIQLNDYKFIYGDFTELEDSLKSAKLSSKTTFLSEVFNFSEDILKNSISSHKEIYIISDFQSIIFDENFSTGKKMTHAAADADIFLIKTGENPFSNLGLDSIKLITKLPGLGKDLRLKVNLKNFSNDDVFNKTIKLFVNGGQVSEKAFDVKAFENKEAEFKFNPGESDKLDGYFELVRNNIKEDELIQDNKIYFSMNLPSGFRISLIDNNPVDSKYINLALESAKEVALDSSLNNKQFFEITHSAKIDGSILNKDVVIISGKPEFSESEANFFSEFISNGGGALMFSDKNINISNYNNVLFGKINSVLADRIIYADTSSGKLKFGKVDFEHPVLSDIFSNKNLSLTNEKFILESPAIKSYLNFLTSNNSVPLISLSNNAPLLTETDISKGKIIISSISADTEMSDFPLKSIFVPLIVRSILYLGNKYDVLSDYTVGKQNLINTTGIYNITKIKLPDGNSAELNIPLSSGFEKSFLLPYAGYSRVPGVYAAADSSSDEFKFSLNNNPLESNNAILSKDEILNLVESSGYKNVKLLTDMESIGTSVEESRKGIGLWKYLLLGAFIFLLLEIFISKKLEEG